MNPLWTLEEGRKAIQSFSTAAAMNGLHLGLCGSVLHIGQSDDDLDIIVFPLTPDEDIPLRDETRFVAHLTALGVTNWRRSKYAHDIGDKHKTILTTEYQNRRIDWFFLNCDTSKLIYDVV